MDARGSVVFLGILASAGIAACGQPGGEGTPPASGSPRPGPGARAVVSPAVHHDLSAPLLLLPPAPMPAGPRVHRVRPIPRPRPSGEQGVVPGAGGEALRPLGSPGVPLVAPPIRIPTLLGSFEGIGQGFTGPAGAFTVQSAPPDSIGAVGPDHYVQIVNTAFAVFSKTGTVLYGPVFTRTLWSGFGGGCQLNDDGDGSVLHDQIADRWIIAQFSVSGGAFLECVAVSATPDPTGPYHRYAFQYADFPDYPKLAVWPDAYYATFNMFNAAGTGFLGARACAYDRAAMLAGMAATQQCFMTSTSIGGLLPGDLDGARLPPAGAPNPLLALGAAANQLAYFAFHVDWATPASSTFSGPTNLAVAAFTEACGAGSCVPQPGTGQRLDGLGDRLMNRLAYRNFGDHEALVVNHSVTAGSSVGVRWYEVRLAGGVPSVYQQGTHAPDSSYRWMGSAAMDQAGNLALGYSASSSTLRPSIRYAARLAGDPLGQLAQGEGTIITGGGSQTGNVDRWGDYTAMVVDPTDDCTFWYTNQYQAVTGSFNWHTRIASFKLPGCPASPASARPGDLDGDGKADVLWRNGATGETYLWLMDALVQGPSGSLGTVGIDWQIAGVGDLDGDGKADVVWRNGTTGEAYVWLMNGLTRGSSASLGVVPLAWQIAGVGDLDGDGRADVLWRNGVTGEVYLWLMNGLTRGASGSLGTVSTDWQVAGVGDLDGDGKADVLWRNGVTGEVYLWLMNGLSRGASASLGVVPLAWQIAGVGDLDGDGKADVLWRNGASGETYLWLMNGLSRGASGSLGTVGIDWQVAQVGDFDGDGKADVLWRNGTTGEVYLWLMNGLTRGPSGSLGSVPIAWQVAR